MLIRPFGMRKSITANFEFERFRMGFLVALIIYNYTEATFKALHFLFLIFFVVVVNMACSNQENVIFKKDASLYKASD